MKSKTVLCFVCCILLYTATTVAQDKRAKIKDYLNQEILITDSFAGQSITLIKENKDYFILRKYFGSGVPVIGSVKYKVIFNSSYQIAFSEVVNSSNADLVNGNENFTLCVEDKGLSLYLNGLKIVIICKSKEDAGLYIKNNVLKSMTEHDMPWVNIRDPKSWGGLAANYGIYGIPYYVMISPENKIIDKWGGFGKGSLTCIIHTLSAAKPNWLHHSPMLSLRGLNVARYTLCRSSLRLPCGATT